MSRRRGFAVLLSVSALACGGEPGPRTPEKKQPLSELLLWSNSQTEAQLVSPVCETPPKPGKCGMLATEWARPERAALEVERHCPGREPGSGLSGECLAATGKAFVEELPGRYPKAKWNDITRYCASNPDECRSLAGIEAQWLISHNASVRAEGKARDDKLIAEYSRNATPRPRPSRETTDDDAETRRAIGAAIRGFGEALSTPMAPMSKHECSSDFSCRIGYRCVKTTDGSFCAKF